MFFHLLLKCSAYIEIVVENEFENTISHKQFHHHHHHIYLFTKWRHITRKKLQLPLGLSPKHRNMQFLQNQTHKLAELKWYLVTWWGDSEGPKGHLSLLPPHQVKVKKKEASRFSQSATFYDKKFYAKLKQSVAKICTFCTVYMHKTHSHHVKKMQDNIRIVLTLSISKN